MFEDVIQKIVSLAEQTNRIGPFKLWDEYGISGERMPADVCVTQEIGQYLLQTVVDMRPKVTLEIGAGFGVSGMYLSACNPGLFISFEANKEWAAIAQRNLMHVGKGVVFSVPFNLSLLPDMPIDIAFIDAIHTESEVGYQFDAIRSRCGLIIIDDIQAVRSWFDRLEYEKEIQFDRLGIVHA